MHLENEIISKLSCMILIKIIVVFQQQAFTIDIQLSVGLNYMLLSLYSFAPISKMDVRTKPFDI